MPNVAWVQDLSKIYSKPGTGVEVAALRTVTIEFVRGEYTGWLETGIYRHSALAPGVPLEGPAVVEEMSATSVVLPGQHASVDRAGNIIIES